MYTLLIIGTSVSVISLIPLSIANSAPAIFTFSIGVSLGESIWAPRLSQYATLIAPPEKLGSYLAICQLPLFLSMSLSALESLVFMSNFCSEYNPETCN